MNAKGKIQAQLSAYLDGELDEPQLRQVEEALENDGALRVELAQFAATRNLLRDLPVEKPPVDLVSRILAEAERNQLVSGQHAEGGSNPLRWVRYVASAAVLLMAATFGMIIAVTLCSPGTYQSGLVHNPTPARGNPDGNDNIAIVNGDWSRDAYISDSGDSSGAIDRSRGSGVRAERSEKSSFDYTDSASVNNDLPVVSGKGGGGAGSSGIDNNVERITAVLAGNLTNNEIIYSDRFDDAQKQVEGILNANGIAPVVTEKLESTAALAKRAPELPLARGNFYVANRLSSAQVQYEAYVTPKQMEKVQEELGRLRAKQNVSQHTTVLTLAKADEMAKDGGWNFNERSYDKRRSRHKDLASASGNKVDNEGRHYRKVLAQTVSAETAKAAKKFSTETTETATKQEERSPTRETEAAEGDPRIALAPCPAESPAPARTEETPAPAAKPAMPTKPSAPAPSIAPKAQIADDALTIKSKLGDSNQAKYDSVGGVAKERAGDAMTQRKTAETSAAVQTDEKDSPAIAAVNGLGADLLGRRSTLATRFGAGTDAPSTRPVGQVAGPVGGQIAAGTPNVRVTPPANQPATPKPVADADKDTRPIVQVTLVDGKTMHNGKKITIHLDRQGQAKNSEWSQTRPSETLGFAKAKGLAKAEQSPTDQIGKRLEIAQQSVRPGISQRGVLGNGLAIQHSTARVQRLLITLNYRHVDQANKTADPAAATEIIAGPTSQVTTSQSERADKKPAQQKQAPKQK